MGKREETLERLNAFMDSLPVEARKKCAMCNDTLVHIIKQAEVEVGVGTATAARILAERVNEGAAPQDIVSANALRERVRYHSGNKDENGQNDQKHENPDAPTVKTGHNGHKITPDEIVQEVEKRVKKGKSIREAAQEIADEHGKKQNAVREAYRREKEKAQYQCTATQAMSFAKMAIFQLERITKDDDQWNDALVMVENWITEFRSKK
jgi:hypothetical protein